jgi:DNA-binding response OmpR family regulator
MIVIQQEKESLEELNRTKLRFFTNITHELLTPLTVISAAVGELRSGASDSLNLCRIAQINVAKLVKLLQQILEFRKVETDNFKLKVNYGDITTFIANSVEALRPLTLRKFMKMELRLPEETIMGYFDSDKLDKILYNLISNAAKYSDEYGTITVTVSIDNMQQALELRVTNTGAWIPKDKLDHLFTRFYDGDYREHKTSGTGIGLSLTRDLVILSHGQISVESNEWKGTSFIVNLPISAEKFESTEFGANTVLTNGNTEIEPIKDLDRQCLSNTSNIEQSENIDNCRAKILIIEDNDDLSTLMRRQLKELYEVVVSTKGLDGLNIAYNQNIDLIVTDLSLPDIDGVDIIKRLRDNDKTKYLPIIVLTARRQDVDKEASYVAGADVYLAKPFDYSMLKACISTQIKSRRNYINNSQQIVINLKKVDYQSPDSHFIKLATEVVERNIDKTEFDIPTFAREVGMSQTHLFRKLKELTDLSPSSFIRKTRLQAACRILKKHPDIRIGELAFMVGFSDPHYFGRCFKTEFGVSPGEYK